MLTVICKLIEKIVCTGVDGTILILPMIFLIWILFGQAKDCIQTIRRIWREESEVERISQRRRIS